MSLLGSIVGSVGGAFLDNIFAGERQEDSQSFSAQQYATRYQTTVKDLQAAGLNPMLAYGQGPGSAPSSSPASPGSNFTQAAGQHLQSQMNSAQIANINADTANKAAQARLIDAQAAQATASAQQAQAQVGNINASTENLIAQLKNIPLEGQRLQFLAENLRAHSSLLTQQQVTEAQRPALIQAQTDSERSSQALQRGQLHKILAETGLLNADQEAIDRLDNLGRTSKEFGPVVRLLLDILNSARK